MLGLPPNTEVATSIYKKDILENFSGTPKQKDLINNEVQSIKIVNELSPRSIPVEPSEKIAGIYILHITTKTDQLHVEMIETLFRLIPQKIVLVFEYENRYKLAIHNIKTFITNWLSTDYKITLNRLSLDEIWQQLVEEVGNFKVDEGQTLEEKITLNAKIEVISKEIEALKKKQLNTKTPRMKFDLHQEIIRLQDEIDRLRRSN